MQVVLVTFISSADVAMQNCRTIKMFSGFTRFRLQKINERLSTLHQFQDSLFIKKILKCILNIDQ